MVAVMPRGRTQPYGRLLSQGSFYTAGMQLSNAAVVLPYICVHQGIGWAAALLFPAYGLGSIVGNSVSPAVLQRVGAMRHLLLAAIAVSAAALFVCDAVVPWNGVTAGAVFLTTSAGGGFVIAISGVAYSDMISSKLCAVRRGELLLVQGATGSVLATVVALLVVPALAHGDEMAFRRDLLWLGAAGLAVSGVVALFVGPVRSTSVPARLSLRDTYRQGFAVARSQPWFRRYAVTYLLFAPVALGTTFYTLRIAHHNGSLHVLVILSSGALVIGSTLWRKIFAAFGVRGVLLGSAVLSAASALLCVAAESCGQWSQLWAYGTVFFLATIAAQAVFVAAISWISVMAPVQHRGTLIGFCATLVAVESAVLGGILGGFAQQRSAIWPDLIVLLLSILAAVAALGAPGPEAQQES